MPSSTAKQARFMAACAHDAGYASCPPKSVAREFNQADKGRHFAEGGLVNDDAPGTFAGASIPDVSRVLKAASELHDQVSKGTKAVVKDMAPSTPKPPAERDEDGSPTGPTPKAGAKERPVDAGGFLNRMGETLKGIPDGLGLTSLYKLDQFEAEHPIQALKAGWNAVKALPGAIRQTLPTVAAGARYALGAPADDVGIASSALQGLQAKLAGMTPRQKMAAGVGLFANLIPGEGEVKAAADVLENPLNDEFRQAMQLKPGDPEDHPIGAKLRASIIADPDGARAAYAALPSTDGGRILAVDEARELSPEYRADRSLSEFVHEPLSAMIKQLYKERLAQPVAPGYDKTVVMMAGGTGAGKTSALRRVPDVKETADTAHIIYDSNLNGISSAKKKIDAALDAGFNVDVPYVYRDPMDALSGPGGSMLQRAETKGRTVPIVAHQETHNGAFQTVRQLQQEYADNPDVAFHVIDNSLGPGNAKEIPGFESLLGKRYNIPVEELTNEVWNQYKAGKISEKTLIGTLGADAARAGPPRPVPEESGQVPRGQPQPGDEVRPANPSGVDLNATNGRSVTLQLADAFDNALQTHFSLPPDQQAANSRMAANAVGDLYGRLSNGKPRPLLQQNGKLAKGNTAGPDGTQLMLPDGSGVETYGLALAPAYRQGKFTTCPNSASCAASCLGKTSGGYAAYGGGKDLSMFKGPRLASLQRTQAMLADPGSFAVRLSDEISALKQGAAANGNTLGIRLNVLSDINPRVHQALINGHPDVQFYDYTKNNSNPIAPNHHYTYSSTGLTQPAGVNGMESDTFNPNQNWKQMRKRLDTGSNVAMAFTTKKYLPEQLHDAETGNTYRVVNGDTHDFRPLDAQPPGSPGVIVGLKNKNRLEPEVGAAQRSSGFFVRYDPQVDKQTKLPTNTTVVAPVQTRAPILMTNDLTQAPAELQ